MIEIRVLVVYPYQTKGYTYKNTHKDFVKRVVFIVKNSNEKFYTITQDFVIIFSVKVL